MVVGILGLLVLGPERLPVAARTVGLFIGKIRRTMGNIQDDLERQVRTDELKEKLKDPYATFLDEEESAHLHMQRLWKGCQSQILPNHAQQDNSPQ